MSGLNKILLLGSGSRDRIEWRVIENAYQELRNCNECDVDILNSEEPFHRSFKSITKVKILVVHSPLVKILFYILIANLVGCKIYAFIWDFYPVKIYNKYYRISFKRFFKDKIENIALSFVDKLIIPSNDFMHFYSSFDAIAMGIWPKIESIPVRELGLVNGLDSDFIKIVFSGQVNETRGLSFSIDLIKTKIKGPFVIYIVSPSRNVPDYLILNESVVFLGELNNSELIDLYRKCDFGIVSLSLGFNGPAFPSKTFDYLSAGLPILYCGPRLDDYLSMIINSGVGVDISSLALIDKKLHSQMIFDFFNKIKIFEQMTFFDVDNFKKLLLNISNE